jgi:hypothetical protein
LGVITPPLDTSEKVPMMNNPNVSNNVSTPNKFFFKKYRLFTKSEAEIAKNNSTLDMRAIGVFAKK